MGILYFYSWLRKTFPSCIDYDLSGLHFDNLFIDMNGLFHSCAQKVYCYDNDRYKWLLNTTPNISETDRKYLFFEEICKKLDQIVQVSGVKKKIFIAIDSVAPISKQCQQSQRRFNSKGIASQSEPEFNPHSISVGTELMDELNDLLDWFISKRVSDNWSHLEVVFSNHRCPGEGEHNLMSHLKNVNTTRETCCIYSCDADLIMLTLISHQENICIFREYQETCLIDIDILSNLLMSKMKTNDVMSLLKHRERISIDDFVFLCFLLGNDFLPCVPGLDICNDGIEKMLSVYRRISAYGMTEDKTTLKRFLTELSREICITNPKENRRDYYTKNFPGATVEQACITYLTGLFWVSQYYSGTIDWAWYYPYYAAPYLSDVLYYIDVFERPNFVETKPNEPLKQLMCILPPESAYLLPSPLHSLISKGGSCYREVDENGNLPFLDQELVTKEYNREITKVDPKHLLRNSFSNPVTYTY